MKKTNSIQKIIYLILCFSLIFQQAGLAQIAGELDIAGYMKGNDTLAQERFRPAYLRYLSYDSINNDFKLLLDKGTELNTGKDITRDKTKELLDYFFIGISLPNESFWVNLRPDSPDNIIDSYLAQTDMGKILLEADVQLKKDTARMTSPETAEGREYWDKLYKKAGELFGAENITIPTLTRPWIVPDEIIIRDSSDNAYIYKATLKVMLEQDYLKDSKDYNFTDERLKQLNEYSTQLIREDILPNLTKEVNIGKNYAGLRQVYHSLILAQWFKQKFNGKEGTYSRLINRRNLQGLTSKDTWSKDTYFKEYRKNFQQGEYNLKEQVYTLQGKVFRSYMSGGVAFKGIPNAIQNVVAGNETASVSSPIREAMLGSKKIFASSYHNGKIEPLEFPFEQPAQAKTVNSSIKKSPLFIWAAAILSILPLSSCGPLNTTPVNPPGYTETLNNYEVYAYNGNIGYHIRTDNGNISASIKTGNGQYLPEGGYTLNTITGNISYIEQGNIIALTPPDNQNNRDEHYKKYYDSLMMMIIGSVTDSLNMAKSNPSILAVKDVDWLNKVLTELHKQQQMDTFQASFFTESSVHWSKTIYEVTSKGDLVTVHTYSGYSPSPGYPYSFFVTPKYIYNIKDKSILVSLLNKDNQIEESTLTHKSDSQKYSQAIFTISDAIKKLIEEQQANPTLNPLQIYYLNAPILDSLEEQLMLSFEATGILSSGEYYTISTNDGKIRVDVYMPGSRTTVYGYLLDTYDDSIKYEPSPRQGYGDNTVTLQFSEKPKEYSDIIEFMLHNTQEAKKAREKLINSSKVDIDLFDKTIVLLNRQLMRNFQVFLGNNYVEYTITADKGNITTKYSATTVHASVSGYTLNSKTDAISYIPYPYSLNDENRRITVDFSQEPETWRELLKDKMVNIIDNALIMQEATRPLTPIEVYFLNSKRGNFEFKLQQYSAMQNHQVDKELQSYAYIQNPDGSTTYIPIPSRLTPSANNQSGSSPMTGEEAKRGGIDLRALPITKLMLANPGMNLKLNFTAPIPVVELESERIKIENMLQAKIIPSSERIADYLVSSYKKNKDFERDADKTLSFIADILRIEEEKSLPTEPAFRQILGVLEQIPG